MQNPFARTELLFGKEAIEMLHQACVIVFGVGGVGGYVVEVLARSGVGNICMVDNDTINPTNLNRQIIALHSTLGRLKIDAMEERIHDIYPACKVEKHAMFYLPENADSIDLAQYDYVVDCIDTVKAKLEIIRRCHRLNIPVISSMGAANKIDPTAFRVTDISKTDTDPLAKVLRKTLRKEGITHFKVVCSNETPILPPLDSVEGKVPASNAFVPATAGLIIGGEVIKDIINNKKQHLDK